MRLMRCGFLTSRRNQKYTDSLPLRSKWQTGMRCGFLTARVEQECKETKPLRSKWQRGCSVRNDNRRMHWEFPHFVGQGSFADNTFPRTLNCELRHDKVFGTLGEKSVDLPGFPQQYLFCVRHSPAVISNGAFPFVISNGASPFVISNGAAWSLYTLTLPAQWEIRNALTAFSPLMAVGNPES